MNRWITRMAVGTALTLGAGVASAWAQHDHAGHQHGGREAGAISPKCPISGGPVNFSVSIVGDDGPVFFCCDGCVGKYEADPDKYAAKVAEQRKVLADRPRVQVTCPVSGEPVNRKTFIEHDGEKVYFCCQDCIKKFQREPDKYKVALANSYTYQTKCPVMGEEINPKVFATASNGMNVYFCCKGCDKKFLADPAKYVPKLAAQGFTIGLSDLTQEKAAEHGHHGGHGSEGHGGHGHDH